MENKTAAPNGEGRELTSDVELQLPALSPIRIEDTFSRFPIHSLSKKGNLEIRILKKTADGEIETKWFVSPNSEYGRPRQLAYKADTLLVDRRIQEAGKPIPQVI